MYFFNICKFSTTIVSFHKIKPNYNKAINVLQYLYHFNNKNMISFQKIPSVVVLNNQKNFFSALYFLCINNIKIICLTSAFKKNSLYAYNTLLNFNSLAELNDNTSFIFLERNISSSICSRLGTQKLLCFKTVSSEKDLMLNMYPIFINSLSHNNVYIYLTLIKSFVYTIKIQQFLKLNINYFSYVNKFITNFNFFFKNKKV